MTEKAGHASSMDKVSGKWVVKCACGWSQEVPSRDAARGIYKTHRDGVPYVEPPRVERRSMVASNKEAVLEIVADGPFQSEEVRGKLFRKGIDLSEPTVRKLLHALVVEKKVDYRLLASRRTKRIALYAPPGTPDEKFAAKVVANDRLPGGLSNSIKPNRPVYSDTDNPSGVAFEGRFEPRSLRLHKLEHKA